MAAAPGERKRHILQALAEKLANPRPEKITTASLAAALGLSEAALYRHFASKAQMYEGLIDFIEQTLLGLIARVGQDAAGRETESALSILLGFAQKNPGMTRVLTGEALVNEDGRLTARLDRLLGRLEAAVAEALAREAERRMAPASDAPLRAAILFNFVQGRWQQFARAGFARPPLADWPAQWQVLCRLLP